MGGSGYHADIESKCTQKGPDWWARGFELTGTSCINGDTCKYSFNVTCSKEAHYPSWPPDILWIDDHEYVDVFTSCPDCNDL
jgi:hypothetical protein